MTEPSWDQLRTFEAVARLGSLTEAARALGVSQSTVSRRLARLESSAGSPLLLRESPVRLTSKGEALQASLQPMVTGALAARATLEEDDALRGEVTVNTVGELVRWSLVRGLPSLYARHPLLRVRLLTSNRIVSLAANEADVAIRFTRPERGELVGKRLATSSYGWFAAPGLELGPTAPWLGLGGSLAAIPEQRHAERALGRPPRLVVEDVEALGLAVAECLGVAVLPSRLGERLGLGAIDPRRIGAAADTPLPVRAIYLVVHRAKQRLPKVRAIVDWLEEVLRD